MYETSDVLAAIDHMFGMVRTALASIAPNATDDVALCRRIDDAIDAIHTDLADRREQVIAALREGRDPLSEAGARGS